VIDCDGSGPPAKKPQSSSVPGSIPGKISAPVRGLIAGLMTFLAASTCGAVRHASPSPFLHSSTVGSKWQRVGSSIRPSFSPSIASQALSTAWWIIGYLVSGM
jgi:hypothetical protein